MDLRLDEAERSIRSEDPILDLFTYAGAPGVCNPELGAGAAPATAGPGRINRSCPGSPCPPNAEPIGFSRIIHDPLVMGGNPCIRGLAAGGTGRDSGAELMLRLRVRAMEPHRATCRGRLHRRCPLNRAISAMGTTTASCSNGTTITVKRCTIRYSATV